MGVSSAYAITANSLTAETFRQAPSSHIAGTGIVNVGDYQVTQNGSPNMSVNVAAGQAWVPGTLSSTTGFGTNVNAQTAYGLPSSFNEQASYYVWNNGTVNLAIAAADPTNPRIDLVCLSIQDAQYSGSNNQPVLQVITGTPAPSPVAPSAPASTVVVAQIAVAAGASSIVTGNITDERPVARSGLARVSYQARYYLTAATTSINGTLVVPLDTKSYDPFGLVTTGAAAKYTCPVAGYYMCRGQASLNSATTRIVAVILKNGGRVSRGADWTSSSTLPLGSSVADLVQCAAGDTLQLGLLATGAGAALTTADVSANYLAVSLETAA